MVRTKDENGIDRVQPFYNKHGRPMRWEPSLEDWEPYKKMQQEREQYEQEEIMRGQAIRNFKDKHRALMSSISACITNVWTNLKITFVGI